jgi:hypothetical protein
VYCPSCMKGLSKIEYLQATKDMFISLGVGRRELKRMVDEYLSSVTDEPPTDDCDMPAEPWFVLKALVKVKYPQLINEQTIKVTYGLWNNWPVFKKKQLEEIFLISLQKFKTERPVVHRH